MRQAFDAQALARHVRAAEVSPDAPWWNFDRAWLFAPLPSPLPVLIENTAISAVDSRECPALGRAVEALERKVVTWRLDFAFIGEDAKRSPPPSHAVRMRYTLNILLPGQAAVATIIGEGDQMDALVGPVLTAARACEAQQT
jgi:hypothetical protein